VRFTPVQVAVISKILPLVRHFLAAIFLFVLIAQAEAQSTIFIVRHAEKSEEGNNPELSLAGRARAERLARTLADADIKAIYVTEWKRTQQTAEALARARHLEFQIVPAAATESLAEELRSTPSNALVVGHSNTIPLLLEAIGITTKVTIAETEYDDLFVLLSEPQPQMIRLHY
jgi:broad specificity phosphatase PhoE